MTFGALNEVELKLELSAEGADEVEAADLFADQPVVARQHTVYFDTPDLRLAQADISLRIRRVGRKRVQTIKSGAGAGPGLFRRKEWEREVKVDHPLLDDTTPVEALLGDKTAELTAVFAISTVRRTWQQDGIEIALDRGRIVAGERETSFCELELEQKAGALAALFTLSRRIAEVAPAHLGVLSKPQRGYRLLGPAPAAAKAGAITLIPDMSTGDAFQVIARACMEQFRLNELLILEHEDWSALHQARVALRRLRSAFSIHKSMLADIGSSALGNELRWLAAELGKARDLDVLLDRAVKGSLRERLSQEHVATYVKAAGVLRSIRARTLMIDLAEWLVIGDWRMLPCGQGIRDLPARKIASNALDRYHRKIRKSGRDLVKLDDTARHEVRKDAKKLRYATDFFSALFESKHERRRHKRFVSALDSLQKQLGALNDLAVAPAVLASLGLADHPQAAALLKAKAKPRRLASAAASYADLIDAKRFWR